MRSKMHTGHLNETQEDHRSMPFHGPSHARRRVVTSLVVGAILLVVWTLEFFWPTDLRWRWELLGVFELACIAFAVASAVQWWSEIPVWARVGSVSSLLMAPLIVYRMVV